MDLGIRYDTRYEKYCKWNDTTSETFGVTISLKYSLSVNHSQGPERTVVCVYEEFRCESL